MSSRPHAPAGAAATAAASRPTPRLRAARHLIAAAALVAGTFASAPAAAQQPVAPALPPVSVSFEGTPLRDVASFFARFAGRSIVVGAGVDGVVTADIAGQPWDVALEAILLAHGLVGRELASGIIMIEDPATVVEVPGPLVTRVFRLRYARADELQSAIAAVLTERGTVSVVPSINALVVTDESRVVGRVAGLLGGP